jgi:predicted metal-binding membrane protein
MQHRLVASEIEDGRLSPTALAAFAVAWAGLGFASVSGLSAWLGHGHLLEGGLPIPVVLSSFVGGWFVMLLAMMLPTLPRQSRTSAGFVAGFLWIWMAFGLAALLFDAGIHWSVDHSSWLRLHAWTIQAGLLAAAGGYQLSSMKRLFLKRCLAPAAAGSVTEGWLAGAVSVGCCWALMLTAFAAGMTQLGWMVGLTLAMVAERDQQRWNHAAALVGVALLALAAGLVVASLRGSPNLFPT